MQESPSSILAFPWARSRRQRRVHKTRARMLVTCMHLQCDISLTLASTNQFTCKYCWSPTQWTLDKTGLRKVISGSMRKTPPSDRSLNKTFIFSSLDSLTLYLLVSLCILSSYSKLITLSEVDRKNRYLPALLVETEQVHLQAQVYLSLEPMATQSAKTRNKSL